MPKIYTDEYKQSAIELINDGLTHKQVCADIGVSECALQAWVRDSRLRAHGLEPSKDHDESPARAIALKLLQPGTLSGRQLGVSATMCLTVGDQPVTERFRSHTISLSDLPDRLRGRNHLLTPLILELLAETPSSRTHDQSLFQ